MKKEKSKGRWRKKRKEERKEDDKGRGRTSDDDYEYEGECRAKLRKSTTTPSPVLRMSTPYGVRVHAAARRGKQADSSAVLHPGHRREGDHQLTLQTKQGDSLTQSSGRPVAAAVMALFLLFERGIRVRSRV